MNRTFYWAQWVQQPQTILHDLKLSSTHFSGFFVTVFFGVLLSFYNGRYIELLFNMPLVRATPDEPENEGFTLKTRIKCFPFTLRRRIEFKNATITVHFRFVFAGEKLGQENHRIIAAPSFPKSLRFSNCFSPTRKCKGGSFKSLRFEESFRKTFRPH